MSTPSIVQSVGGEADGSAVVGGDNTPIPNDLAGSWAEFWAPQGDANSPSYLLLADGRFGWVAAQDTREPGPRQMSGTWSRAGDQLTLHIGRRRMADGAVETPAATEAPIALQLGACPDNREALAVDPRYACVSLDGQAYFRRQSDASGHAAYFE